MKYLIEFLNLLLVGLLVINESYRILTKLLSKYKTPNLSKVSRKQNLNKP